MKTSTLCVSLLGIFAACGGGDGTDGKNSLILSSEESPGVNCANGGTQLETGVDANGNGKFDANEASTTSYSCNGADGADGANGSDGADGQDGVAGEVGRISATVGPASVADCPTGGKSVVLGYDGNDDGDIEDEGEAFGTPINLCDGNPTDAFGATPVVKTFRGASVDGVSVSFGEPGTRTILSATITTPRKGTVLALASSVAYCQTGNATTYDCAPGAGIRTFAWLTIVDSATPNQSANSGAAVSAVLNPGIDSQLSATGLFEVQAGTYTYNALGMATADAPATAAEAYYGASDLTLVFIPND